MPFNIKNSPFFRNVAILSSGTAIAQAIPIAVSPILTRIYLPDNFGLLAVYTSCVSVLSIIATARFELAIPLPEKDSDAVNIAVLTLKICMAVSLLLFIPLLLLSEYIASALGNNELAPWLFFLPVSVMATGAFNVFQLWCNRLSHYSRMASTRTQNALFNSGFQIALGLFKMNGGLILGQVTGKLAMLGVIWRTIHLNSPSPSLLSHSNVQTQYSMAQRYASHPRHIAPSQLIGVVAMQLPVFLISSVYSLADAGFFALAYRLVSLPTGLIASAIGDVYRQKIAVEYSQNGEFRKTFLKTLGATSLLALLPSVLSYLLAPALFAVVFGESWRIAGEYAQILVIAAYFQFIFTPIDKGALVVGATGYIFVWHLARLLLLSALVVYTLLNRPPIEWVLYGFTLINSLLYAMDGLVEYQLSGTRKL